MHIDGKAVGSLSTLHTHRSPPYLLGNGEPHATVLVDALFIRIVAPRVCGGVGALGCSK